jgi:methanogenic corrinoid protein MtbC1
MRGGKREGSGRKVGSATKKTREIANKALEEGITPLEVMLETMRTAYYAADDCENAEARSALLKIAHDAAKDAAPYVHPKLAAVEHGGKNGGPLQVSIVRFSDLPTE